ncbi:DegT/DnrJ/EryC1/StrS family aminotransferase [Nitrospira sp. M1]
MNVPLMDFHAHHNPMKREILEALEQTFANQTFILGPEVKKLEDRIATYCQANFGIGVSSGTDALLVSLMALGIEADDEVITTPYSFFATAGTIARLGAKPVFVDIDPRSYNIDPAKIESAITHKTKAIIPVHLYGQCADMAPILELASKYQLNVIEDAAQAIGADYKDGRRAGSLGTIGCLSFFPSKNLGALGDGGMVVTNDSALAERIQILRVQGSKPKYYHKFIGGNFRLDTLQAAVLNVKLNYLAQWTKQRQENARQYRRLFQERGLLTNFGITLPQVMYEQADVSHQHIYNQFILRVPRRDQLMTYLKEKGIGSVIYYPVPFHLQECFSYLGHQKGDFPESEAAARETLGLPIYPELQVEQQEYVVNMFKEFYCSK